MKNTIVVLLLILLLNIVLSSASSPAWPTVRGDARNTGHSDNDAPEEATEEKHEFVLNDHYFYEFVVGKDNTAYFVASSHYVYAVDKEAEILWNITRGQIHYAPAVGDNDMVFIGNTKGRIVALDSDSGTKQWVHKLAVNDQINSDFVIDDSVIYVATLKKILALDADTGRRLWRYKIKDNTQVAVGSDYVISKGEYKLTAMYKETGLVSWVWNHTQEIYTFAISKDDWIFVSDEDNIMALDEDRNVMWTQAVSTVSEIAIGDNDMVYTGSGYSDYSEDEITALNSTTGAVKWTFAETDTQDRTPYRHVSVGDNEVVIARSHSAITALDPEDGSTLWDDYSTPFDSTLEGAVIGDDGYFFRLQDIEIPVGSDDYRHEHRLSIRKN
jgi:outer membrane protein assembly factor BamB